MSRLLLVTADDFGLTPGMSQAIIEAHRSGIVTAVSVLGNGPATLPTLSLLDDVPDLEVGVHVALVGEDPPLSPAYSIPTLVDRKGRLPTSWRLLLADLVRRRIDPDDIRRELDAQVALVRSGGHRLTHLNLHQHVHLWPSVRPLVLEAAVAHDIGYVRTPRSLRRSPSGLFIRALARPLAATLASADLSTSDRFLGLDEAGAWGGDSLRRALATVRGAVVEVNVHPGATQDPARDRYRWGYQWGEELAALVDPSTREVVGRAGFRLTGPSAVGRSAP